MNQEIQGVRFFDEFRRKENVLRVAELLRAEADPRRAYHFMEFCGGHTQVFFRYGLTELLPKNVKLIHGPGCPVCVLPRGRLDAVMEAVDRIPNLTVCTYADLMRIPATGGLNFIQRKARGADFRMVYSPSDALKIAEQNPERTVLFLAIGFETTAPSTAVTVLQAEKKGLRNFFVYCLHLLTPPAINYVLNSPDAREMGAIQLDGFVGPGNVSTVIGAGAYRYFAEEFRKPVVVSGFAPLDMMQSILMLVRLVNGGDLGACENQYKAAVSEEGNPEAQRVMQDVFELRSSFEWRGLGEVPYSAFRLRDRFAAIDAEKQLELKQLRAGDHPACQCGAIIRGVKKPTDCKLFRKACTPDNPLGPCMVSSEGTCAAYFNHA